MKYAIVYTTRTGNTKLLANAVKEALHEEDIYIGEPNDKAMEAEILFVGFWTDKGTCSEAMAAFLKKVHHKQLFLFGTAGFGGDQTYFNRILNTVSKNLEANNEIIGSYMCQGKMPMIVRHRYEEALPKNSNMRSMIDNFDKALQHPNKKDLQALKDKIKELI